MRCLRCCLRYAIAPCCFQRRHCLRHAIAADDDAADDARRYYITLSPLFHAALIDAYFITMLLFSLMPLL